MENFENKQSNNPNDEISIIDLFSVFIKYRKLIVFGTLIFSILIILVITIFNGNSAKKDDLYSVEFTIPFLINKNDVNTLIDYDFANDTVLKLKNVNTVANINKDFNVFNYNFNNQIFDQLSYNKFIYDILQKKYYDVKLNGTKSAIILTVKTNSIETSEKFVANIVNSVNEEYYDFLLPLVSNKLDVLNNILDNANGIENNTIILNIANPDEILNNKKDLKNTNTFISENELFKEQLGLQTILKNDIEIFDTVKNPLILKQDVKSIYTIYIVVVFGVFFCFVFLAFLLNALKNIKADKISSEKIKLAWISGKKLFP